MAGVALNIRLVEIGSLTTCPDSLSINLHTVPFSDNPKFALISYARDGLESQSIICNGRPLSVSPKLVTIIRSLQEKNEYDVRLFWIDVICMSQDGMQDYYTQTALTRNIILQASITIAWPETEVSKCTVNFLVEMAAISHKLRRLDTFNEGTGMLQNSTVISSDDMRRYASLYRDAISRLFGRNRIASFSTLINPLALLGRVLGSVVSSQENLRESDTIVSVRSLLDSGYFGRMLSLPDVVLSTRVVLRCVSSDLEWDTLCNAVYAMILYGTHAEMKSSQVENLLVADLLRQRYRKSGLTFAENLLSIQGCNFEETHTADFIFPLLALSNHEHKDQELPHIDYAEGEQQVLQSICNAVVNHFHTPINLSLAGLPNDNDRPGYPSWLPEFGPKQRLILAHPNSRFSAFKTSCNDFIDSPHQGEHRVFHVDTVATVKSYLAPRRMCDQYDLIGDNLFELVRWYDFISSNETMGVSASSDELVVRFAETIQAKGSNHIWENPNPAATSDVAKQTRAFIDFLRDLKTPETFEIRLFAGACLPSHDRRFGQTASGKFCLLPSATELNDIVCVIRGFKVPVLLRRTASGYQNVGECYVHGIMHGEAEASVEQVILLE